MSLQTNVNNTSSNMYDEKCYRDYKVPLSNRSETLRVLMSSTYTKNNNTM